MSTIKINEVEAKTNPGNVKVIPNGTGVLEVAGDGPGTLQLDDAQGANGVKIKAPAASAGQSYTLTLPTSDFTQGEFLRVDSITAGSGSTATGQLGSVAINPPSTSSLNASVVTGSMPAARYSVGSIGGGIGLVTNTNLTTGNTATTIDFTGLEANTMYRLICKEGIFPSSGIVDIQFLDASNNPQSDIKYQNFNSRYDSYSFSTTNYARLYSGNYLEEFAFEAIICTGDPDSVYAASGSGRPKQPWMQARLVDRQNSYAKCEIYAAFDRSTNTKRIHGLRVVDLDQGNSFQPGTNILLYKFAELG